MKNHVHIFDAPRGIAHVKTKGEQNAPLLCRSTLGIILFLTLAGLGSASSLWAQSRARDIVGIWMTANDNAKVEIYEQSGRYFGKIVWLNPNPKIAEHGHSHGGAVSKPKVGDVLLKDLVFDGDSEWEDGTIFDPYSQNSYSCYVAFSAPNVLKVRGYTGFYFIGQTEYWTRSR